MMYLEETKLNLSRIAQTGVERAILAICFRKPDLIVELQEKNIRADYFSVPAHRFLFLSMEYLYSKSQTPTPATCIEVITGDKGKKAIEEVGLPYVISIAEMEIPFDNLNILINKLQQSYTRMQLITGCTNVVNTLFTEEAETMNPTELISQVNKITSEVASMVKIKEDVYKFGDDAETVLKMREENPNAVAGLELGYRWSTLDYLTQGGQQDDLVVVCGRSKTGKSVILTNWAVEFAVKQRMPILYISTEMSDRLQEDRILSMLSGVPMNEIVSGLYIMDTQYGTGVEKKERVYDAVKKLKESKLYHVYMPNYSMEAVQAITKKYKIHHDIKAMFFDYIKVTGANDSKGKKEYETLGFLTMGLKDLGGELQIPVYTAVQENRSNVDSMDKDERNVGGSDRILQNASKLIFIYNKSEEMIAKEGGMKGNQQLKISFQRNANSDCPPINIQFDREFVSMREV